MFAVGGFGAGGFEGVEAGGEFAFVVDFHGYFRIVWRGKGRWGKWFGINVGWVVTQRLMAADGRRFTRIRQEQGN